MSRVCTDLNTAYTYIYGTLRQVLQGKKYPYKRGIALPLKTWITLTEDNIDEIDQALQDVKKEDNDF